MYDRHVILCTLGTRGDILPFVAMAQQLLRQGYATTILSNENWRALVEEAGAEFYPIAEKDPPQSGRDDYAFFLKNTLPSFTTTYDYVTRAAHSTPNLLLVYRTNMQGMECAAEKIGLPHIKVVLQPSAIRSFERPPWPMTTLAQGRLKPIFKCLVVPGLYLLAEFSRRYRRHTNAFRRSCGLVPHRFATRVERSESATLIMTPAWFALPQPDWPKNCHCVGFPFPIGGEPDTDIENFIAQHGKPIVFTPGTGIYDTDSFFEKAEETCRALAMPGLFLSPTAPGRRAGGPPILTKAFADMGEVLPKSRLLVHHGGIGTTAQALRAGVPQLILPGRFDQPDNATRVASMGLGAAIMKDDRAPGLWASVIRELLESDAIAQRLSKVSASIGREHAAQKAVAVIKNVMKQHAAEKRA